MERSVAATPYRHSRVSGNPAVVCQDCGIIRQYRRDSRLRGNDGRKGVGRTVRGANDGRGGGKDGSRRLPKEWLKLRFSSQLFIKTDKTYDKLSMATINFVLFITMLTNRRNCV